MRPMATLGPSAAPNPRQSTVRWATAHGEQGQVIAGGPACCCGCARKVQGGMRPRKVATEPTESHYRLRVHQDANPMRW